MNNRKKRSRKQSLYKMKGCYKKSRKNYSGGTNLAYLPNNTSKGVINPFLSYVPKSGGSTHLSSAYPSPGPKPDGFNFLNPSYQTGGSNCGCGPPILVTQNGGCEGSCSMTGGSKHRKGCKCSECRNWQSGGGFEMTYPNGLIGKSWGPNISEWPGVDGVDGGRNHLGYNTYTPNDVSREMKYENASGGGKNKKTRKHRKGQKGGFIGQDLLNLGKFGTGSFYNAIKGYPQPVSPMPWKDQLTKY